MNSYVISGILVFVIMLFSGCSSSPVDAKAVFQKSCANCHGKFARKSAFGKSQVIAGFTKDEIVNAIVGYQEGTYGKSMKGLMKSEVNSFNKKEIDALAVYISNIGKY